MNTQRSANPSKSSSARPTGTNKQRTRLILLRIIVITLLAILFLASHFIYSHTFIPAKVLWLWGLLPGIVTFPIYCMKWSAFLNSSSKILNGLFHLLFMSILSSFVLLGINYWGADTTVTHETALKVHDVYIKKQSHHHRGRRTTHTEHFYMVVSNEEGQIKEMYISRKRYNKLAARMHLGNQKVKVNQHKGYFGFMIFSLTPQQ